MIFNFSIACYIVALLVSNIIANPHKFTNVDCGPNIDYIDIDPGRYRYTPYVVQLHRCHGSNLEAGSSNRQCVPKKNNGSVKILKLNVFNKYLLQNQQILVENHTQCEEICTLKKTSCNQFQIFTGEKDCQCKCKYSSKPSSLQCPGHLMWDQSLCSCKCPFNLDCPKRKIFDRESCSCTCKAKHFRRCSKRNQLLNENDCSCIKPQIVSRATHGNCQSNISFSFLAVIIIIEALLLLVIYLILYVYCYKKLYLQSKTIKYRSQDTAIGSYKLTIDNEKNRRSNPSYTSDSPDDEDKINVSLLDSLTDPSFEIYPNEKFDYELYISTNVDEISP